jgi:NTP pyrophosphatase (non-canonical NTP hydrolase)
MNEQHFVESFNEMCGEVNDLARRNGFWDDSPSTAEKIALCHSELSEALEADRHKNPPDDKISEFTGMEAELADLVIRTMDLAAQRNLRLGEAIIAKHKFNLTRPYKHGKSY